MKKDILNDNLSSDVLKNIRASLQEVIPNETLKKAIFFKTKPNDYAYHDKFIGISSPNLRKIAKLYNHASLDTIITLLHSPINEERLLALFMLVNLYQKGDNLTQEKIYQLYIDNIEQINNWNLVDASAHLIIGAYLHKRDKKYLLELAKSNILWKRRISIVATWYFIKQNDFEYTIKLANLLLDDKHDLIHKAVGWMLREIGKRQIRILEIFLDKHAHIMPRTMLRYSIEKFDKEKRMFYLLKDE